MQRCHDIHELQTFKIIQFIFLAQPASKVWRQLKQLMTLVQVYLYEKHRSVNILMSSQVNGRLQQAHGAKRTEVAVIARMHNPFSKPFNLKKMFLFRFYPFRLA